MEIKVGISNRHVHLNKEVFDILFDNELTKKMDLTQPKEFASNQTLTIKSVKSKIENVRVLGPLRSYTQVEISKKDAIALGINPPVRHSGNLEDAEVITLETTKGSVTLNCCIIAKRHLHISLEDSIKYNIKDKDKLNLRINNEKKGTIEVEAKVAENAYFEVHLDTDDACAFMLNNNDTLELIDENR